MLGETLNAAVSDARQRTLDLVSDLSDSQMLGPLLAIVNPPLWETGHVAWFQEYWSLRRAFGRPPLRPDSDTLYNSAAVAHDSRWSLPLPDRRATIDYLRQVRDAVLRELQDRAPTADQAYFVLLSVFHEDMHTEAFTYTRQTFGYPPPLFCTPVSQNDPPVRAAGAATGDAEVGGASFPLGAVPGDGFVFDNEKWSHPVEVHPFKISKTAVSQAEYLQFVEDGGYERAELWSKEGRLWRQKAEAAGPVYWRREPDGSWSRRVFDVWVPLEPEKPVIHVNWFEADAYCRWAGRRLPTEAEWEMAASWDPAARKKRRFPWGDEAPQPNRASLDWNFSGTIDVDGLPGGDSPCGCRQMIGNVWEWTATPFGPYPGFEIDPYKEYSAPWFGDHMVLRGGCWTTRARLIRNTWRNFYKPDRRDVWAGFRTCAV